MQGLLEVEDSGSQDHWVLAGGGWLPRGVQFGAPAEPGVTGFPPWWRLVVHEAPVEESAKRTSRLPSQRQRLLRVRLYQVLLNLRWRDPWVLVQAGSGSEQLP